MSACEQIHKSSAPWTGAVDCSFPLLPSSLASCQYLFQNREENEKGAYFIPDHPICHTLGECLYYLKLRGEIMADEGC